MDFAAEGDQGMRPLVRADGPAREAASLLDHGPTRAAVQAERTAMRELGAGCRVPAGFLATITNGSLIVRGVVGSPSGGKPVRADAFRQKLHRARMQFVDLILAEVANGLADPTPEKIQDELAALGLLGLVQRYLPADVKSP